MEIQTTPLEQYKYLTLLTMLFITIFLVCDITAFRMVYFLGKELPLSGFIIPIVFAMGDIIAENYGYRITMKVIRNAILCQLLFGVILTLVLKSPSLDTNILNKYYSYTFEHLLRTSFTSCLSVSCGMLVNAFLISKLKIYMHGKHFWIRTLISSCFSEIVLCTIAYFVLFSGLKNIFNIITIIYMIWIYKMLISLLINPIIVLIAQKIKILEHSDVYDVGISYNPFIDATTPQGLKILNFYKTFLKKRIDTYLLNKIPKNDFLFLNNQ